MSLPAPPLSVHRLLGNSQPRLGLCREHWGLGAEKRRKREERGTDRERPENGPSTSLVNPESGIPWEMGLWVSMRGVGGITLTVLTGVGETTP